ncbi:hypothetical protein F4861DRAFT_100555 [Xylaria intraflava]|nr:hypothetical protein F4861DRAFT_100555 [Xylaria intraflava]
MPIQSRPALCGAQWRQSSRRTKFAIISVAVFFLLAVLCRTGTVNVDYVRNRLQTTPGNHGDEPIQQEKNDTPIIDGVPNEQNDRPIPAGIIEGEPGRNHPVEAENESLLDKQDDALPVNRERRSLGGKDDASLVKRDTADTDPTEPHPQPIAGGVPLRVMFIGASMTLGDPPQSAYRMQLREWLTSLGNEVNCVGTNRFGDFKDNDVQAFPSTPIKVLHEKALDAVPAMQPNLIVINAGSSDCFQENEWGSAHGFDYTRDLADFLLAASPRATIILSTLITSTNEVYERCIKSMNAQIRQVAHDLRREGKPVILSEQHYDQGLPDRVTHSVMKDDAMHPTFEGWAMMGEIYKRDIRDADAKGWILAPVDNGIMYDGDAERDLEDANAKPESGKRMAITSRARRLRRNNA